MKRKIINEKVLELINHFVKNDYEVRATFYSSCTAIEIYVQKKEDERKMFHVRGFLLDWKKAGYEFYETEVTEDIKFTLICSHVLIK